MTVKILIEQFFSLVHLSRLADKAVASPVIGALLRAVSFQM